MLYRRRPSYDQGGYPPQRRYSTRRRGMRGTLLIAIIIAGFYAFKYFSSSQVNPFTGEKQHVGSITPEQEVALGIQSAPSMIQKYGGLHPDQRAQQFLDQVGHRLVSGTTASRSGYQFDFHLLSDPRTVNAFALPGGQTFITAALFERLENEDQLAGVMGHEIGHVLARHGAERIAKSELIQGLTGAAVIASGDYSTAQAAQMIGNLVNMKYGRDQELESDDLGVRLMIEAGYDPEQMVGVMKILEQASGGQKRPEFYSTHPSPENRVQKIRDAIRKYRNR